MADGFCFSSVSSQSIKDRYFISDILPIFPKLKLVNDANFQRMNHEEKNSYRWPGITDTYPSTLKAGGTSLAVASILAITMLGSSLNFFPSFL